MSESSMERPMEQFNINELAGASAIILTGISSILVIIFKSRCYCKFRVGISDKFNLCMCERKPPVDIKEEGEEEEKPTEKPKDEENPKDEEKPKDAKQEDKPIKEKPNIQLIPTEPKIITGADQNNNNP